MGTAIVDMSASTDDFSLNIGCPGSRDGICTSLLRGENLTGTALGSIEPYSFHVIETSWSALNEVVGECHVHNLVLGIHVHEIDNETELVAFVHVVSHL